MNGKGKTIMKRLVSQHPFRIAVMLMICAAANLQAQAQKKRTNFEITIDSLIAQIDVQAQDRDKMLGVVNKLYVALKQSENEKLDNEIEIARLNAVMREALLTMDRMTLDAKGNARPGELVAFLGRVVDRDQELFDSYLASKEKLRFEYERQLAKIKSEQTLLKSVRRDLEKLKNFPTGKEQTIFFLSSVKSLLDGLDKLPK